MSGTEYSRYLLAGGMLLCAVTIAVYYPGLGSGFVLDDVNNLGGLGSVSERGILHYLATGFAGPSGRPLSLLSFALQHDAWPTSPFAFKAVNLAIHLGCGGLIYLICIRIGRYLKLQTGEGLVFTFFVTTVWLLHPIQLTTVLYAVQRMTQLSALFVLLGIYLYLTMRDRYIRENRSVSLPMMGLGIWGCTLLAILAKENGILLLLFIPVISGTLLCDTPDTPALKKWKLIVFGLPLTIFILYLIVTFDSIWSSYGFRPYNMGERLLTEAVVVLDYLKSILLPYPGAFSLYHDDFPISRGLLSPPGTLISIIIVILMVVVALLTRKHLPVLSFAILWFFTGHLLESTHFNLELYFEHRNYLPALGIFILIGYLLVLFKRIPSCRWPVYIVILAFSSLVIFNTLSQMRLWTDPLQQHIEMVKHHPDSIRAQIGLGNQYIVYNRLAEAKGLYREMANEYPAEIYPHIKLMAIQGCVTGQEIAPARWQELINMANRGRAQVFGITEELVTLVAAISDNDCREIDPRELTRFIVSLALNPEFRDERAVLHELAARLGIVLGDAGVAYHNVMEAVRLAPVIPRQILKIRILMALEEIEEAQQSLLMLEETINSNVRSGLAWGKVLSELEAEMEAASAAPAD